MEARMSQRKNTVILKGFEQHFILLSFLTVVTALMLMVALVMGAIWVVDPRLLGAASLTDTLNVSALGFALLAVTYYYTLRVNHRVSGPVFVLMRNMDRLGEGDLTTEMRLRHQDHLQEISAAFNRNVAALCDKVDAARLTAEAISSAGPDVEIKPLVDKLLVDLDKIKTRP
jgi:methyl-accepting chemotaxis protein